MQVLFTGASSVIGKAVLDKLVESTDWKFCCLRHRRNIEHENPRVTPMEGDIRELDASALPERVDLVIHFAAITHASDASSYRDVNFLGTQKLAAAARSRGCRRFVYISTRCATAGSGSYGESKLAAEDFLRSLEWDGLLIIRPSEVYGADGGEGIDKFISYARDLHLVPMLLGDQRIRFSPLHAHDFVEQTTRVIKENADGVRIEEMCGPEELSGIEVASRLAREFSAVPIPMWWPLVRSGLAVLGHAGIRPVEPEQAERLVCEKTCRLTDSPSLRRFYYPSNSDADSH